MNTWWLSAVSWNTFASSLANHLWQTTLCVIAAAVLVRFVGVRHPRVRHAIWLTASVKFLVPFSVLVAAGQALAPETQPVLVMPAAIPSFEIISRPFLVSAEAPADAPSGRLGLVMPVLAAIWLVGGAVACGVRWTRWRRMASTALDSPVLVDGREADAVRRVIARLGFRRPLAIHESAVACGPGLFGVHRARLLWPAGLSRHLGDEEIDSIVAHEISHLRRADNLTSLVHTVVETLFWFHPVVWWLGARLVHEREQACDQDVLRLGVRPETYAESLLKVCRFSLRSPQPFVAGMTGSDLSQRVEAIMTHRSRSPLSVGRRALIGVVAVLTVAGPIAAGVLAQTNQTATSSVAPPLIELVSPFREPAPVPDRTGTASAPTVVQAASPPPRQATTPAPVFQNALDADFARATRTGGIKALRPVSPSYSPQARRAGIQGSVEIEALVMPDGSVGAARVTKSLDRVFGLDEQALAAARQWVFSPPVDANGQPVRAVVTLILDFRHASTPDLVRAATEPAPQGEASATPAQAGDPNAASREPRYFRDYLDYVKGKEEVGARLQEASGVLRQGAAAHGAQDLAQSAKDLEFRRGAVSAHTVGLTPPKTLRTEQPRYTSSAMRSKIQGSVLVEAVVMPDGTVGRVRVTKSLDDDLGLDAEALAAARLWRFEPGRLNGQPVAVFVHLVMDFRLY